MKFEHKFTLKKSKKAADYTPVIALMHELTLQEKAV